MSFEVRKYSIMLKFKTLLQQLSLGTKKTHKSQLLFLKTHKCPPSLVMISLCVVLSASKFKTKPKQLNKNQLPIYTCKIKTSDVCRLIHANKHFV